MANIHDEMEKDLYKHKQERAELKVKETTKGLTDAEEARLKTLDALIESLSKNLKIAKAVSRPKR